MNNVPIKIDTETIPPSLLALAWEHVGRRRAIDRKGFDGLVRAIWRTFYLNSSGVRSGQRMGRSQARFLVHLMNYDDDASPWTMADGWEEFAVNRGNMAGLLASLEKRGYVKSEWQTQGGVRGRPRVGAARIISRTVLSVRITPEGRAWCEAHALAYFEARGMLRSPEEAQAEFLRD